MTQLLGTAPNQAPRNLDLGSMAYEDKDNVNIGGGNAALSNAVAQVFWNDTAISDTKPSLNLDFANSKTLDPRITYTRASTGAYWDGQSTVVAEQNLLTYSQDFDNVAWVKSNATVTANTDVAPDGTTTADTLTATGTAGVASQSKTYSIGSQYCFSVWIKRKTGTGAVHITASSYETVGATISVDGTWQRFTQTITATGSSSSATIRCDTSGDEIYIWGAQLEQRSSATVYTPTTSAAITNYIPTQLQATANTPRFDHDIRQVLTGSGNVIGGQLQLSSTFADGSAPSTLDGFYTGQTVTISSTNYTVTAYTASSRLLTFSVAPAAGAVSFTLTNPEYGRSLGFYIEQQSTNLLTYSSGFDTAAWSKTNTTVTAAAAVAPDGSQTAQSLYASSGNIGNINNGVTKAASAATYSYSVYAKANGFNWITLTLYSGTNGNRFWFNLSTGATGSTTTIGSGFTSTSLSITSVGNGWYRCTVVATSDTLTSLYTYVYPTNADATFSNGNGYSGILIWGAQLEANTFATSYIPTTSSQVTRAADAASMTGSNFLSWYRQDQGTLYVENSSNINPATAPSTRVVLSLSDNTSSNLTNILNYNSTFNGVGFVRSGASVWSVNGSSTTQPGKSAFSYAQSSLISVGNGASASSFIGTQAAVMTQLNIGSERGSYQVNGYIRKLQYFPKALSSAELQELTA